MIAKIALVSMLAAVAVAAPEPQFPLAYGAATAVTSEEITYEKRCKEVVNKHCAGHVAAPLGVAAPGLIVKREAEADPQFYAGLHGIAPYAHAAIAPAPIAYSVPEPVVKTVETPCTEVKTEHCVDVPIIKPVVTPVETCLLSPRLSAHPLFTPSPR